MVIESFTGVRSGSLPSLRSGMSGSLSAPGRENQIAGHEHPYGRAGADRDGRLDVEVALGDAIAGARRIALRGFALGGDRQVRSRFHQRSDRDALEQRPGMRSEEHTSELQSLMRISYAVFCLK